MINYIWLRWYLEKQAKLQSCKMLQMMLLSNSFMQLSHAQWIWFSCKLLAKSIKFNQIQSFLIMIYQNKMQKKCLEKQCIKIEIEKYDETTTGIKTYRIKLIQSNFFTIVWSSCHINISRINFTRIKMIARH